jgi:ABC-type nitrate/sulfonate/bicarbonate transport system substrate-binding protein
MIVCGALVVAPDSDVFTPQELAHRPVALDYGNGTAYAGLLMLEGAMPREAVTTRAATVNSGERLAALLRGEFAATVLQEPWITLAQKSGCRLVSTTFFHGTWVADPSVSAEAYAAFVRAITAAVRHINADKRRYVDYFIRDFPEHAGVAALTRDDFDLGRIQLKEPGPIPEAEARWAWEWMASWGLMSGGFDAATQINRAVACEAHELAGARHAA